MLFDMIEAVVDTSVVVSAFRSSLGASYRLLQTIEDRKWRPVISPTLAFEYEAVLKRRVGQSNLSFQEVDDFIDYMCSRSRLVQTYFRWRPVLRDPDDDRILEVAVRAQATLVTFNKRDFMGADRFGVKVVDPKDFLTTIGYKR